MVREGQHADVTEDRHPAGSPAADKPGGEDRRSRGALDAALRRLEPVGRESMSSVVAAQIREAVIDGTLAPGMQLSEAHLAERLSVSRGPVREAMQRLIQEGLLRAERHRGVFVVELGVDDVRDIYLARAAIERAALGVAMASGDAALLRLLEDEVETMREAVGRGDWPTVAAHDLRFHEALIVAAGSPRLTRMFRTLIAETQMYLVAREASYAAGHDLVGEHERILAAMRRHDDAEAARLLDAHFSSALEHLSATAQSG